MKKLSLPLFALVLAACAATRPVELPAAQPTQPAAPASAVAPPPPSDSAAFAALSERILDQLLVDRPALGRSLGLHEFDSKLARYDAAGIAERTQRLQQAAAELAAVDAKRLDEDARLDLALLRGHIDQALFGLIDMVAWKKQPDFYGELFAVDSYVNRSYAPLPERAQRLLAHEKAALVAAPDVVANLESPLPKPVVETALKIFAGYAEYLRGEVATIVGGAGDAAFQQDFARTNEALAQQADAIVAYLRQELPRADDSYVLGRERFEKLLLVQEGLEISLAEFKQMGERDLALNKQAMQALQATAKVTRPKPAELFDEARLLNDAARKFIVDTRLVTLPSDDAATVKETPPFMRWNAAFLDMPGPWDTAKESFYYITLPDPKWPKREREEYVMTRGVLLSTTVHEVYPGHFLQGQWVRRAPTRAQKMLDSYSFVEGWAHYGEQLMLEQGFGAKSAENRIGQLSDALLRNCRMVVSLGLHTEGMTLEQAQQRFRDDCFQDKATAREQAVRGTFDPGYFAYTLGKLQILALRAEAQQKLGERFSLQRFHDALLSHGSPPVPLIRERVLAELAR